nr:reverse transcriptase domain-containing protein [Tanacetum cinerariifolium]
MVPPTNNRSTKDVQPPVFQIETSILNSEPVVAPIIEPVAAPLGPYTKSLLTNKDKLSELARTPLNEHCSVVLLKKLPKKLGDPDKFLIPCDFPRMAECLALADLGASINLMPLSMWNKLSFPKLSPMCMTLELADRSVSRPVGVAEDVFVKVGTFHFLADFVVVDFDADPRVPLILEKSFLKTGRALIDVFKGELTLRVGKEALTFNLDKTSRYSANYNDMTANRIDVIDMACEEYSQEVLGFSYVIASGNPTPYYDPIVSTSFPTLTPFGDSDFLLEEVDAFLALEDDPASPEVDQPYFDPEGDILLLEAFLNDDPSLPPPNQGNYLPQDLPPHLEYAFLKGDDKLPVIIAKDLSVEESSFKNRPPMLNKENYVPWSSRLLRYAKSIPNGKLIHNTIINGPYVRRMIPKLGDTNREVPVNETFHVQTDDELTEKELKQIEADDEVIQTILLGLPEDIYAAVDSCETAQEIWLRVQQMMKGSDIEIQEKKAKLFNEWERFTSNDGESIESYCHRFLKLMNDLKRNKHFPKKIASNLKFLNNLQPEWSRHVTIVHQTKDLHTTNYSQLYDFVKYNQKEVDELKAERLVKTQDPLALMATSNNPYNFPVLNQDQPSFDQNYMQQPFPNPKDITDPTAAMNMALALMAKAFKLNYATPTKNNQMISSNPPNRQIAQPGMNMGQDRQMQMVGGNANQNGNGNLVAARAEGNAAGHNDLDEIKEVNANCILMSNLQQASTSGTQTDKALVYDSDGSAEVHNYEDCYDNDIFNMFTQEEQYTELLESIPKSHQVPQNDNNVISEKEVDELKAERLVKTQGPLALMATSNNPYNFLVLNQDQPSFDQNYMQQPLPNPKDITDPTAAMNMALALMAKAFKLNYATPTKNNQRISSNPPNRQIAQPGMNMGQDRQMQMVGGNANQNGNGNLVAARAKENAVGHNGNQIRCYNCRGVGHFARNCTVKPRRRDAAYLQTQLLIAQKEEARIQLQAEEFDLMAAATDLDEIKEVNANCILMSNLQQSSTSGTQTDKAPVYDSDRSAEVHNYEDCYDNDIFNMFTQEEQYTELLEPIPKSH